MSYKDKKLNKEEMPEVKPEVINELRLPKDDIYKRIKKLSSFKKIKRSYKLEQQKKSILSGFKRIV